MQGGLVRPQPEIKAQRYAQNNGEENGAAILATHDSDLLPRDHNVVRGLGNGCQRLAVSNTRVLTPQLATGAIALGTAVLGDGVTAASLFPAARLLATGAARIAAAEPGAPADPVPGHLLAAVRG